MEFSGEEEDRRRRAITPPKSPAILTSKRELQKGFVGRSLLLITQGSQAEMVNRFPQHGLFKKIWGEKKKRKGKKTSFQTHQAKNQTFYPDLRSTLNSPVSNRQPKTLLAYDSGRDLGWGSGALNPSTSCVILGKVLNFSEL